MNLDDLFDVLLTACWGGMSIYYAVKHSYGMAAFHLTIAYSYAVKLWMKHKK